MSTEAASSPLFDPSTLIGIYAVQEWAPGRGVRFARPLRIARLAITLPIVLAGYLSGPVWFAVHRSSFDLFGQVLEAGVIGAIGGMVATFVAVELAESTPRTVWFDWGKRVFTVSGWYERRTVPFEDLAGVQLTCLRNFGVRGSGQGDIFNCEVHVAAKTARGSRPLFVMDTEAFPDVETARRVTLPLATELAAALKLPLEAPSNNWMQLTRSSARSPTSRPLL